MVLSPFAHINEHQGAPDAVAKIINRIQEIDDYFPFEIKVTREYIVPELYKSQN